MIDLVVVPIIMFLLSDSINGKTTMQAQFYRYVTDFKWTQILGECYKRANDKILIT